MSVGNFEHRLNQIHWAPCARPSPQMVENVLPRSAAAPGHALWNAIGVLFGILIGFGIKATVLPEGPFGADADLFGYVMGALSLGAGAVSAVMFALAFALHNQAPQLLRFSGMNMLMIVVLLLS